MLQAIGNFIGVLVKTDERNFDGSIRQFFRIKIAVDVLKPLKKGIRLKKDSGEWFTVDFKYERLPTSCFVCGVLGHAEKFCPKDVSPGVKPYNAELRAGNRRGTPTVGLRWIAPEKMVERRAWAGPDQFAMGVDKETAPAATDKFNTTEQTAPNLNT